MDTLSLLPNPGSRFKWNAAPLPRTSSRSSVVQPVLGRTFAPADDHPSAAPVVVLHHSLWKNYFHSDASIIGKAIALSSQAHTVIGVMPVGFDFPGGAELWTPLGLNESAWDNRNATFLQIVGRLKPGVSFEEAKAELAGVVAIVNGEHPEISAIPQFPVLAPIFRLYLWQQQARHCPSLGSFTPVARHCLHQYHQFVAGPCHCSRTGSGLASSARASSGNLFRQFFAEGLVLAFASALGGSLVARVLVAVIIRVAPAGIPRLPSVELNVFSLLFACAVSFAIAIIFGLAPALLSMKRDLRDLLNQGTTRVAASRRGAAFRKVLIVAEVAVTMLLLISAGTAIRSFRALQQLPLGFATENILTAQLPLRILVQQSEKLSSLIY